MEHTDNPAAPALTAVRQKRLVENPAKLYRF